MESGALRDTRQIDIEDMLNDESYDAMRQLADLDDDNKIKRLLTKSKIFKCIPKKKIKKLYDYMIMHNMIRYDELVDNHLTNSTNRMKSGVLVLTIYTKPSKCSGKCLFCPTEPDMPKSYLSSEPLGLNAKTLNFDAFMQMSRRLDVMKMTGNILDKLEIIVVGGSWLQYPYDYQCEFMRDLIYAVNVYGKESRPRMSLADEIDLNKNNNIRISGITIETRPDDINPTTIRYLREQGCTRVQIGVQHIDNNILGMNKRGHTIETSIESTQLLKEAGFKVDHHYMINLYGSSPEKDVDMFREIFYAPHLQPDQIKIYPCFVNEYAELYGLYKQGLYRSYSDETLVNCIAEIKKIIPPYVRINRIMRDFPKESIASGSIRSGIRNAIKEKLHAENTECRCIRCRELGINNFNSDNIELDIIEYDASRGKEYFISFVSHDKKTLYGFLRLRFNYSSEIVFDELKNSSIIRELHVYGKLKNKVNESSTFSAQHNGLGGKLIQIASDITVKNGLRKISVISGIGVKRYYEKHGFNYEGTYMSKEL